MASVDGGKRSDVINDTAGKSPKTCSTPPEAERCAICLSPPENKAVTDTCLHAFCFSCLKEWSKVKAVCPLCKNSFQFILYNVRANDDYDRFEVPKSSSHHGIFDQFSSNHNVHYNHWFRENWPDHMVGHWMNSRIHEMREYERYQVDQENNQAAKVAATSIDIIRQRRLYYRDGIQVSCVRNNKQVRDISSTFYQENPAQIHRLAPWLKRELVVLFGANCMMVVNRVYDLILSAVATLGITSSQFYDEIKRYLLNRTDHFLKEFISFASSPHEISSYDRNASYQVSRRMSLFPRHTRYNEVTDEMHYMPGHPIHLPGLTTDQSLPPPLAHVRERTPLERRRTSNSLTSHFRREMTRKKRKQKPKETQENEVFIIESSPEVHREPSPPGRESSDDEVEFVKYIKPPHLRTPDAVIELSSSSDSDKPGPSNIRIKTPPKYSTSTDSDSDVAVKLRSVVIPVSTAESRNASSSSSSESKSHFGWSLSYQDSHSRLSTSSQRFQKVNERKRPAPSNNALSRAFNECTRSRLCDSSDEDSCDFNVYLKQPKLPFNDAMKKKKRRRKHKRRHRDEHR